MIENQTMPPAVILAGGQGKRLLPLTATCPKPLLPLVGKPILFHILKRLEGMGITQAYVMTGYKGEQIEEALAHYKGNLLPVCRREETPLGSAGCLQLIPELKKEEHCLVVSGDAYFEFDLREAVALCRKTDAAAVLCLAAVEDPRGFGMVDCAPDGRIHCFVEKPTWPRIHSDTVNTGIYVLGKAAMELAATGTFMDFGMDVFPKLLQQRRALYSHVGQGFWCDIGTPEAYRRCNLRLSKGENVLGAGVKLAATASLTGSVLLDGVTVGSGASIRNAVIAEDVILAEGALVDNGSVLGAGCVVGQSAHIGQGVLLPAGTIVAANAVLHADFSPETDGFFTGGTLVMHPYDRQRAARRVGRAYGRMVKGAGRVWVLRKDAKSADTVCQALCEGVLACGVDVIDGGVSFSAEAGFAVGAGSAVLALLVSEDTDAVRVEMFDENGLHPDARFEREFTDLLRQLPHDAAKSGILLTDKDLKDRYCAHLCLQAASLAGMTVWVAPTASVASLRLEKALRRQGAKISQEADLYLYPSEDGRRISARIYGMTADYWQIFAVLALEQVKKTGSVLLPHRCPEHIKQMVLSAGGNVQLFTQYPENAASEPYRRQIMRRQSFVMDGLAAGMAFANVLAKGELRAGTLSYLCGGLHVREAEVHLSDKGQKMRTIVRYGRDFDGEGLLRRYREGYVRVTAGEGEEMHLMAEAAEDSDAAGLIEKAKREILQRDV